MLFIADLALVSIQWLFMLSHKTMVHAVHLGLCHATVFTAGCIYACSIIM